MKRKSIRSYLLAGLIVWMPILVTFLVLRFIVDLLDRTIALLPEAYQPAQVLGFDVPGIGVLLSLGLLLVTGVFATNFLGQRFMKWGESILVRIPLVRPIYNTSKQVIHTVLSPNGDAFRKVLLVEYPRKGMWSLAFQTGTTDLKMEITKHAGTELISIFIPTTPNPTSGFLLMVARAEVTELSMTVEDALKFIISLGVMKSK